MLVLDLLCEGYSAVVSGLAAGGFGILATKVLDDFDYRDFLIVSLFKKLLGNLLHLLFEVINEILLTFLRACLPKLLLHCHLLNSAWFLGAIRSFAFLTD